MAMQLTDVLAAMIAVVSQVPGVKTFPDAPPEQFAKTDLPAFVVYSPVGEIRPVTHDPIAGGFRTIAIDLHFLRKNLPTQYREAMPFADLVPNALMAAMRDPENSLSDAAIKLGRFDASTAPIRYQWGRLGYGGLDTIGFQFQVDVSFMGELE